MPRKVFPENIEPVEPVESAPEKASPASSNGVLLSEFTEGATGDNVVAYAGFRRWCEVKGLQSERRTTEAWKDLLTEYLTAEVK